MKKLASIFTALALTVAATYADSVIIGDGYGVYIDGEPIANAGMMTNVAWGDINGDITNQTDLWSELTNKATLGEDATFSLLTATNGVNVTGDVHIDGNVAITKTLSVTNITQTNLTITVTNMLVDGVLEVLGNTILNNAIVLNDASASNEIVSWQVMTNHLQDFGYLTNEVDPIWTAASNLVGYLANDQTWTGTNIFSDYVAIGTTDTSLLGIVTTNDPVGPSGPFISTNALVVGGNIVPGHSSASLGSLDDPWESLFVQNNSIYYVGGGATSRMSIVEGDVVVETTDDIGEFVTNRFYVINQLHCPTADTNIGVHAGSYISITTNIAQTITITMGSITNAKPGDIFRFGLDGPGTAKVVYDDGATTQTIDTAFQAFTLQAIDCDPLLEWRIIQDSRGATATVMWGSILGTISDQTDLWAYLTNTYTIAQVDALDTALQSQISSNDTDILNLQNQTSSWNEAYTWVSGNSNSIASVFANTSNWNTAYSWGDHALEGYLTAGSNVSVLVNDSGYLTTETDPIWSAESNLYYLASNPNNYVDQTVTNGLASITYVDNATNGVLTVVFAQGYLTAGSNISVLVNDSGYLTSYTETDPIWSSESNLYYLASNPNNYVDQTVTNGLASVTYVDNATNGVLTEVFAQGYLTSGSNISVLVNDSGYLTSYTETDPIWSSESNLYYLASNPNNYVDQTVTNGLASVTYVDNATNGVLSEVYAQGYLTAGSNISTLVNDSGYLTAETDPVWSSESNLYFVTALFAGSGTTGLITSAGGDAGKFLKADGTWDTPAGAGNVSTDQNNTYDAGTTQNFDVATGTFVGDGAGITNVSHTNLTDISSDDHHARYTDDEATNAVTVAGFLQAETDPVWSSESNLYYLASNPAGYITGYTETDPIFTNWLATNTYVQTETDPVFGASAAGGIVAGDTNNWTTAYSWGDHSTNGYLTEFTNLFAGAGTTGLITSTASDTNNFLRGDGTWQPATAGITTNDSPTMAPGTEWTFALASVTNSATNGTQILNYQTGTNLFVGRNEPGVGNKEINLAFSEKNASYYDQSVDVFPTWTDIASFIYSGSDEWGEPDTLQILAGSADGSPALRFRIYDIDNANEIAIITNFTGVAATIVTSTNVSNLPTNAAQFCIQVAREASGPNNVHLYSVKLRKTSNGN